MNARTDLQGEELLDKLLDLAYEQASNILIGTKRELTPIFVLVQPDGSIGFYPAPWRNDIEKNLMAVGAQRKMRQLGTKAYSLLTECWTGKEGPGFDPDNPGPGFVRPMDRPDRGEGVSIVASDKTQTKYSLWDILRDTKGRCCALVGRPEGGEYSSWLGELLK